LVLHTKKTMRIRWGSAQGKNFRGWGANNFVGRKLKPSRDQLLKLSSAAQWMVGDIREV
jgi:hypothetical protein